MIQQAYEETLARLYTMLPMYQNSGGKAFKKGLDNINELCWAIGLPQWRFNTIHVAGTNGKGSVSSMLTSVLIEAGYKVGTYTSPHLINFTERIKINGREMSKRAVVEFVDCYERSIQRISPSFFEVTVAMAFDYFAENEVDIAVIEVGLGGRLDSTNIIRPEVSVITNISMDHTDLLGDTLDQIAFEKAGIIKPFTPVVIGERRPETLPVFQKIAADLGSPICMADEAFKVESQEQIYQQQEFVIYNAKEEVSETYQLDLMGHYQRQNLLTALTTIEVLREDVWEIKDEDIIRGLSRVRMNSGLRGRMEELYASPRIWVDTGHNEAGVKALVQQLDHFKAENLHIVWGMVKDKDHHAILALLPTEASYYFVKPTIERGLDAHTLQIKAEGHELKGHAYETVQEGLQAAIHQVSNPRDLIFIGGSTFVVADVLKDWEKVAKRVG